MARATETLSEKHGQFVPLIAAMERLESSVGSAPPATLRLSAEEVHESLAHGLIPHAVGEGRTVFPVLRRITGTSTTSVAMNKEHQEIARLTDELERLSAAAAAGSAQERRLRETLHSLRGVLEDHLESENEVCYTVLRAELSPEDAHELCAALDRASEELRRLYE